MLHLSIYRYNPETDSKPYLQEYDVNPRDIKGIMLLDALEAVKVQDPSLAFRRSCAHGVCGSDGMNINGKNGLACLTRLQDLPNKVTIRPLPSMPIVRDLIVDLEQFYEQFHSVKPYLNGEERDISEGEYLQDKASREKLNGLYECVLCACCTTSCPSFWWNPKKFLGPAALLWACRFIMDSRDMTQAERLKDLDGLWKMYRCHNIMNCTNVCPKGLNPNKAIYEIKHLIETKGKS
ncbi:MAG: succinate dehydrogenase iron-sulfur subunit [Pseudomonadota bacterium]|nr:succinate dehydrogenase iron-sulfur subunit [Pseudomonadota bacterium]